MRFISTVLLTVAFATMAFAQTPITIAAAHTAGAGATVTVEGIVTNGNELGTAIRYIQDATGGIALYSGTGSQAGFAAAAVPGTLVRATGLLVDYKGLLEMNPITAYTVVSSGNAQPAPIIGTPALLNEANEAMLITIPNATFTATGNFVYTAAGYDVTANGVPFKLFIRNGHPLIGTPIPTLPVEITGVVSQFTANVPAIDGYQLLPRTTADFVGFYLTTPTTQTNITTTSFDINWSANIASKGGAKYGLTPNYELGHLAGAAGVTNNTLSFSGLQPAQLVYVRPYSVRTGSTDTAWANKSVFITTSLSTGTIQAFFNFSTEPAVASSTANLATTLTAAQIEQKIVDLINNAQSTIDCAIYNNNRTPIVAALNAAKVRGLQVRYVMDASVANTAIASATFPTIAINPTAIMHNKFMVIDAGAINTSFVWTGSLNWTDGQMVSDANNMILVQDQSLAKAYTLEFEEMYGSTGALPNAALSLCNSAKKDNTPHYFKIGGRNVECFFSPSDATETKITNAINGADNTLEFALLTFTSSGLATAVRNAYSRGVVVRGLDDGINDTGSQYTYLQGVGVDIRDAVWAGIFHHKYGIIDATNPASDPTVVTGSHNWSAAANGKNDENTLIIHDAAIANQFLQEFTKRWNEITATINTTDIAGMTAALSPNPATDYTLLQLANGTKSGKVEIVLFNAAGQMQAAQIVDYQANDTQNVTINTANLPSGNYFVVLHTQGAVMARKLQVLR
jgi:phosphatidylserine/phosphatidylglycerophosphate/cardiolipin synthase-like enzyme